MTKSGYGPFIGMTERAVANSLWQQGRPRSGNEHKKMTKTPTVSLCMTSMFTMPNKIIKRAKLFVGMALRRLGVLFSATAWRERSIHAQEVEMLLQDFSSEELNLWRQRHLQNTLSVAQKGSPFYRQILGSDRLESLEDVPVTSKKDIKNSKVERAIGAEAAGSDGLPNQDQFVEWRTSGSSGVPYKFLVGKHHRVRHDAQRAAVYRKVGVPKGAKIVEILGGVRRDVDRDFTYPTYDRRVIGYFRPEFALEIFSEKPILLYGNGSHLLDACRQLKNAGKKIHIPYVCNSSEVLLPEDVAELEEFFGCKFFEIYGMCEAGNLAYRLPGEQIWNTLNRRVLIEILDQNGQRVTEGEVGEIVVTTLTEGVAPLLRYATGDYATLAPGAHNGEADIRFGSLDGRMVDDFEDSDGKLISSWQIQKPSFWAEGSISKAVRRWQVIQKENLTIQVKLEIKDGVTESEVDYVVSQISKFLSSTVSNVEVAVEVVDQVHLPADGKFRPIRREMSS